MIARLTGRALEKQSSGFVILDVNGVGYGLHCPLSTLAALPADGSPVTLYVYTHVREDALQLFGFATSGEKKIFDLLISVSGIGPRLGINILGGIGVQELAQAISRSDSARLRAIPGVGKKLSELMVVELKDKIGRVTEAGLAGSGPLSGGPAGGVWWEVPVALVAMGYRQNDVDMALRKVRATAAEDANFDTVIRAALQALARPAAH